MNESHDNINVGLFLQQMSCKLVLQRTAAAGPQAAVGQVHTEPLQRIDRKRHKRHAKAVHRGKPEETNEETNTPPPIRSENSASGAQQKHCTLYRDWNETLFFEKSAN